MSNTILNLRIAYWHLQVVSDCPWLRFSFNRYWWEKGVTWRTLLAFY